MQPSNPVADAHQNGAKGVPAETVHANGGADPASGLRDLLHALQAMRVGDFSVRMASDQDGINGKIADVFNEIVASNQRLALMREFEQPAELSVHHLLAELYDGVDWVLVEGFKSSNLLKLEVWRPATGKPARYPDDDFVVAIATDAPESLPQATLRPVLDLNDADAVAEWLVENREQDHDEI